MNNKGILAALAAIPTLAAAPARAQSIDETVNRMRFVA